MSTSCIFAVYTCQVKFVGAMLERLVTAVLNRVLGKFLVGLESKVRLRHSTNIPFQGIIIYVVPICLCMCVSLRACMIAFSKYSANLSVRIALPKHTLFTLYT